MKRNSIIKSYNQSKQIENKRRIAFHEAGHAAAIHLNNKARKLPPVFFQINVFDLNGEAENEIRASHSIDELLGKASDHYDSMAHSLKDYLVAFEADIINLLIGPLAEAKHIYNADGELFNHQLINLQALKNYGGSSDLVLANDYLQSFSACKKRQDEKLAELFDQAFNFINDQANWTAISKLADYILNSNKAIISCEEVVSIVEY
jgi:hypothetical protein